VFFVLKLDYFSNGSALGAVFVHIIHQVLLLTVEAFEASDKTVGSSVAFAGCIHCFGETLESNCGLLYFSHSKMLEMCQDDVINNFLPNLFRFLKILNEVNFVELNALLQAAEGKTLLPLREKVSLFKQKRFCQEILKRGMYDCVLHLLQLIANILHHIAIEQA
jgi:hypothetical protein